MKHSDKTKLAGGGFLVAAGGGAMFQLLPAIWPGHEVVIIVIAGAVVLLGTAMVVWGLLDAANEGERRRLKENQSR